MHCNIWPCFLTNMISVGLFFGGGKKSCKCLGFFRPPKQRHVEYLLVFISLAQTPKKPKEFKFKHSIFLASWLLSHSAISFLCRQKEDSLQEVCGFLFFGSLTYNPAMTAYDNRQELATLFGNIALHVVVAGEMLILEQTDVHDIHHLKNWLAMLDRSFQWVCTLCIIKYVHVCCFCEHLTN